MKRTIEQYRNGDPEEMSKMSQAAIFFALQDMKTDILALHYALFMLYSQADILMPDNTATELARVVLAFKS